MDEQSLSSGEIARADAPPVEIKVVLCLSAWIVGVVGIGFVEGGQLSWNGVLMPPVLSPAGFLVLVLCGSTNGGWIISMFSGWAYYIALTIASLRAKRKKTFRWAYIALAVSILINIGGCAALKDVHIGC